MHACTHVHVRACIQVGCPSAGGFDLSAFKLFLHDACFREGRYSNDGRKVQLQPASEVTALGPPIRLFDFEWESGPIDEIVTERVARLPLTLTRGGLLNAFVVYFHLHCDSDQDQHLSSGPDDVPHHPANGPPTHWDQCLRYLPAEMAVRVGEGVSEPTLSLSLTLILILTLTLTLALALALTLTLTLSPKP